MLRNLWQKKSLQTNRQTKEKAKIIYPLYTSYKGYNKVYSYLVKTIIKFSIPLAWRKSVQHNIFLAGVLSGFKHTSVLMGLKRNIFWHEKTSDWLYTKISSWRKHLHEADGFSRPHFQMHFFSSRRRVQTYMSHNQIELTYSWVKAEHFQNPELRNSKLKTCSIPTKIKKKKLLTSLNGYMSLLL